MRAKHRRRFWMFVAAVVASVGSFVTYRFPNSVLWANIQSELALILAAAGCYAAETPVEPEDGADVDQ